MDQAIRNKLRGVVTQCRKLLEDSVREELQGKFGVYAAPKDDVQVDANTRMTHLDDEGRAARKDILDHFAHIKARGFKPRESLDQLVREVAFTHLNRLCAYKMMAARQVFVGEQRIYDVVGKGVHSKLVQFYLADRPDQKRQFDGGNQEQVYQHFLDWLGGLLSEEIGVLFSPHDPANRLYPPQPVLDEVLVLINDEALADIWTQDETIGWVYQYFTPIEMRKKARSESRSPRNSHELAYRNQFFTPRYVVEFLTDNTLGRIWYEMRKGDTKLKHQCQYMVRRPSEVFLPEGQNAPEDAAKDKDDLPQEELLKLPVYIPHRLKKDPRELKILDPACGSGHFLLYCFDLLLTIYEEAYADPDLGPALQRDYPTLDKLRRDVPRLILAHNLHGIDIDLRASQIAALALWLRCQRAYQDMELKKDRPKIIRSNFVCAEPMPGEERMLREFIGQVELELLGQLVEVVFDKMKLAGEAGSLLKIEEDIREAVAEAKRQYDIGGLPVQRSFPGWGDEDDAPRTFAVKGLQDAQFFEQAEDKVVEALRSYAEKAQNGHRLQRRLFSDDAVQGFAFIDLSNTRFDVILMNPPFGELNVRTKSYVIAEYEHSHSDILAAFVERTLQLCQKNGFVGAITNRNCFYLTTMTDYRKEVLQERVQFEALLDLGEGVLDAMVEPAAYVMRNVRQTDRQAPFIRLLIEADKGRHTLEEIKSLNAGKLTQRIFLSNPADFSLLSSAPLCYWVPKKVIVALSKLPPIEGHTARINVGLQTGYDWQFLRLVWEADPRLIAPGPRRKVGGENIRTVCLEELSRDKRWAFYSKTDVASPWYSPITLLVDWGNNGHDIKTFTNDRGKVRSRPQNETFYFRPGFSYVRRTTRLVPFVIPSGVIPTAGRSQVYPEPGHEIEVLGTCASRLGSAVARFFSEKFGWPMFQASMIQAIPAVSMASATVSQLEERINRELEQKRRLLSRFEPWQEFAIPAILDEDLASDAWQLDSLIGHELEVSVAQDAGLSPADLETVCRDLQEAISLRSGNAEVEDDESPDEEEEGESISLVDTSPRSLHAGFVSYCVGVVVGRWDVRMARNRAMIPKPQQVLDPISTTPPGTLLSPDGFPARCGQIVSEEWLLARPDAYHLPDPTAASNSTISDKDYPLPLDWDGILVDDPDHPDDISKRARTVYDYVWGPSAEIKEKEACQALGVSTVDEYFRKSGKGGFWQDHLAVYKGKKRPSAPIYWLLQSSKKNYAIWLYYHRLGKDSLFKVLQNYVLPKINLEKRRLEALQSQKASTASSSKEAKRLAKDLEKQEDLLSELQDFEDKLRRAANLNLDPDLNDGVVLNIAPLWELVPWKEAKNYWQELLEGKYEWSSIGKQLREKELVK
ncbi:MAG: BREX-1 system adenine-specific DNA-methyltransferase PglX [Fimbriiglobus sp.]